MKILPVQSIGGRALSSFETGRVVAVACEALDSLGWRGYCGAAGKDQGSGDGRWKNRRTYFHDAVNVLLIGNPPYLLGLQLIFLCK